MSVLQTVSMLFEPAQARIGEVLLDVAITETHTLSARVTEHPLETGCSLSDHVQLLPTTLQLEGIVSNTPTSFLGTPLFHLGDRTDAAYKMLEALFQARQPVQIVTSLKTYSNMVLENLTIQREARTAGALRFSCSAKQIRWAESQVIRLPKPKEKRAQPKKSLGKQPAVPAPPAVAEKAQSLLFKLFGG